LVKLVIEEPESAALGRYLPQGQVMATSRVALVEVSRATAIANPTPAAGRDAMRLLESCMLVDATDALLRMAAELASPSLRTLDAIHLASALRIEADELITYDRRLAVAGAEQGFVVNSPV
jgi:uncharacterized protein